jgi:hypothetical protein
MSMAMSRLRRRWLLLSAHPYVHVGLVAGITAAVCFNLDMLRGDYTSVLSVRTSRSRQLLIEDMPA